MFQILWGFTRNDWFSLSEMPSGNILLLIGSDK